MNDATLTSNECPYCHRLADERGGIFHAAGCAGLEVVMLTRLQYDDLVAKANAHETPACAETYDATDIRYFLGWLSVKLPELHKIETPVLGDAWDEWRKSWADSSSQKALEGRPVRPHRSGGQPVAPAFRDERLNRIDRLMDAQPGTPEGTELDRLVDEQVGDEKASESRCPHCNDTGWTETPDAYADGSVATSRRCPRGCDDSQGEKPR